MFNRWCVWDYPARSRLILRTNWEKGLYKSMNNVDDSSTNLHRWFLTLITFMYSKSTRPCQTPRTQSLLRQHLKFSSMWRKVKYILFKSRDERQIYIFKGLVFFYLSVAAENKLDRHLKWIAKARYSLKRSPLKFQCLWRDFHQDVHSTLGLLFLWEIHGYALDSTSFCNI